MRVLLSLILIGLPVMAAAQTRQPSHCVALADNTPGVTYLHHANWQDPVASDMVRLTYIDHAMFLLQTAGGLSAVTDYVGYTGGIDLIPDVVTMNHAHSSHWTSTPDPAIPHVLEGWQREHSLDLGEMLVRNVPTDIRSRYGGAPEVDGNSIFIFEVAGLCIGHLGHLHHEPDAAQYATIRSTWSSPTPALSSCRWPPCRPAPRSWCWSLPITILPSSDQSALANCILEAQPAN